MALELHGIAVPFYVPTRQAINGKPTMIAPGAFLPSIQAGRVQAWLNHCHRVVLGDQRDGSLTLCKTERALVFHLKINSRGFASFVREVARRGELHGCSVSWRAGQSFDRADGTRAVLNAELVEVSICAGFMVPQFPRTVAAIWQDKPTAEGSRS